METHRARRASAVDVRLVNQRVQARFQSSASLTASPGALALPSPAEALERPVSPETAIRTANAVPRAEYQLCQDKLDDVTERYEELRRIHTEVVTTLAKLQGELKPPPEQRHVGADTGDAPWADDHAKEISQLVASHQAELARKDADMQRRLAETQTRADDKQLLVSELQQQRSDLEQQAAELTRTCKDLQTKLTESTKTTDLQVQELRLQCSRLEQQLTQAKQDAVLATEAHAAKIAQLNLQHDTQRQALEAQLTLTIDRIASMQQQLSADASTAESRIHRAHERAQALESDIDRLRQQIRSQEAAWAAERTAAAEAHATLLKQSSVEAVKLQADWAADVTALKAQFAAEKQQLLDARAASEAALRAELATELQHHMLEMEQLQASHRKSITSQTSVVEQQWHARVAQLEQAAVAAAVEHQKQVQEVESRAAAANVDLHKQIQSLKQQIQQLQIAEATALKSQADAEDQIIELRTQLETTRLENESTLRRMDEEQSELRKMIMDVVLSSESVQKRANQMVAEATAQTVAADEAGKVAAAAREKKMAALKNNAAAMEVAMQELATELRRVQARNRRLQQLLAREGLSVPEDAQEPLGEEPAITDAGPSRSAASDSSPQPPTQLARTKSRASMIIVRAMEAQAAAKVEEAAALTEETFGGRVRPSRQSVAGKLSTSGRSAF